MLLVATLCALGWMVLAIVVALVLGAAIARADNQQRSEAGPPLDPLEALWRDTAVHRRR